MSAFIKKYPLTVLMLVSIIMLFAHLGLIQTNIMEARNLISAREMVNNNHWIFTTLNNMPRYEKPPLPTWITAVFILVGGMENMFILRLPVALVCLIMVYFFYRFNKKIQPANNQPLNASVILITSFYIFFAGRDNQWDMYTHAFMMVCIFYLHKTFVEKKPVFRNVLLAGIFFGCSFLSKGPVSLYALWLPFLIAYFIAYEKNKGRKLVAVLIVLVIGLIIGFSWPLYVKYFDPNVGTALSQQAENWTNYETKPFWYYWSFFTQSGVWTIPALIGLMYFYMRRRVQNIKAYTFSFLWTILSVVLLSFIPEKKARYLLPVLIPLAMNTSFYIQYLIDDFKNIKSRLENGVVYFSFGLIALIAVGAPIVLFILFKAKLVAYISWYILLTAFSMCSAFLIINSLYKKRFHQTFYTVIVFMCGLVITAIPLSKLYYTNSNFYAASNLHAVEKKYNIKTYEAGGFEPEIIWSYGNYIPDVFTKDSTLPSAAFGLLSNEENANRLKQKFSNYNFKRYAVVDLNVLSANEKGYNKRLSKNYYLVQKVK